jgi:hypothetical protein
MAFASPFSFHSSPESDETSAQSSIEWHPGEEGKTKRRRVDAYLDGSAADLPSDRIEEEELTNGADDIDSKDIFSRLVVSPLDDPAMKQPPLPTSSPEATPSNIDLSSSDAGN